MMQEGLMKRNKNFVYEDNTVMRIAKKMQNSLEKVYFGIQLFDLPADVQGCFFFLSILKIKLMLIIYW